MKMKFFHIVCFFLIIFTQSKLSFLQKQTRICVSAPGQFPLPQGQRHTSFLPALFYQLFFTSSFFSVKPEFPQGRPYFLLREAETVRISIGDGCHYNQIIQIGEDRFLTYPGNTCHYGPLQAGFPAILNVQFFLHNMPFHSSLNSSITSLI